MASIFTLKNGGRRVQFTDGDGARRDLYFGKKVELSDVKEIKAKIEDLVSAKISGRSLDYDVARWLAEVPGRLYEKLEKFRLVTARQKSSDAVATLGPFLQKYIADRTDVKASTATVFGHTRRNLIEFFGTVNGVCSTTRGERKPLAEITEGDAVSFQRFLKAKKKEKKLGKETIEVPALAKNTIIKRCQIAKQFFESAVAGRSIQSNPFGKLKGATIRANRERDYFLQPADALALIQAAPDAQWRLIVALSRYGGLRCPSEHLALRWDGIDWERKRMTVYSPKTEHRPGQESRIVPIFPEIETELGAVFDQALEGAEFVITRYRDAETNLRTQLLKIIRRAGLKPWPRLFHNMRASRQTELMQTHPIHVVCEWLGNSRLIAQEHYLRVTETDFDKATKKNTAQNTVQASENNGNPQHREMPESEKSPENSEFSGDSEDGAVVATGLEPVTSTMSTWRSNQLS